MDTPKSGELNNETDVTVEKHVGGKLPGAAIGAENHWPLQVLLRVPRSEHRQIILLLHPFHFV